jgi:hypothetical protein
MGGGLLEFMLSSIMVVFSVGLVARVFLFSVLSCLEFLSSVTMYVYLNLCLEFS